MLIRFFDDFANFTAVNFHFLSQGHKRKHRIDARNSLFATPPSHLCSQTKACFQSRIKRWQNTIFVFLEAQLDFLAIFFSST